MMEKRQREGRRWSKGERDFGWVDKKMVTQIEEIMLGKYSYPVVMINLNLKKKAGMNVS